MSKDALTANTSRLTCNPQRHHYSPYIPNQKLCHLTWLPFTLLLYYPNCRATIQSSLLPTMIALKQQYVFHVMKISILEEQLHCISNMYLFTLDFPTRLSVFATLDLCPSSCMNYAKLWALIKMHITLPPMANQNVLTNGLKPSFILGQTTSRTIVLCSS